MLPYSKKKKRGGPRDFLVSGCKVREGKRRLRGFSWDGFDEEGKKAAASFMPFGGRKERGGENKRGKSSMLRTF